MQTELSRSATGPGKQLKASEPFSLMPPLQGPQGKSLKLALWDISCNETFNNYFVELPPQDSLKTHIPVMMSSRCVDVCYAACMAHNGTLFLGTATGAKALIHRDDFMLLDNDNHERALEVKIRLKSGGILGPGTEDDKDNIPQKQSLQDDRNTTGFKTKYLLKRLLLNP
eukprot:1081664-Amphidinium_carterae.1